MTKPGLKAVDLDVQYNMIEDYHQTMVPPIGQTVTDRFVAVQNDRLEPRATELVTVSNKNNLMRFYPDVQSDSGWAHEEVEVDGAPNSPITKLVAFYQRGTLFVLAHYNAGSNNESVFGMARTVDTGWGKMEWGPNLENDLGRMRQTDSFVDANGKTFFYGISENYSPASFVIVGYVGQQWTTVLLETTGSATESYRILPGFGGSQMTVVSIVGPNATFRAGSVKDGRLVWTGSPQTFDLGQGNVTASQVFSIPSGSGDQGFLLLGDNHQLYHIKGYAGGSFTVTPMTGGTGQPPGALQVSVGVDSRQRYMVFAVDTENRRLWLLRQNAATHSSAVGFDDWVQLGNAISAIACPQTMVAGPEVFIYDLTDALGHLSQQISNASGLLELEDGSWFTQVMETASAVSQDPSPTTTYTTEFVAIDKHGLAVGGTVLNVFSDRHTVLNVNGLSYHVDSKTPAKVVTDKTGKITVAEKSVAVTSSKLTVTAPEFGAGVVKGPYRCDLRVHQRLAGLDEHFPVTGESMKAAGLMPKTVKKEDADTLATKVTALGQVAVNKHNSGQEGPANGTPFDLEGLEGTCFEVDFKTGDPITIRDLAAGEADELFGMSPAAPDISTGEIWGDVCQYFRHAIHDLEKISFKVAEGAIYVTLTIGKVAKKYHLTMLSEVADLIHTFISAIVALAKVVVRAIELLVKWLRTGFPWDDIIRTKVVIKYFLEQTVTNVETAMKTELSTWLENEFDELKKEVIDVFDNLETRFEKGVSFNKMVPKSSNPAAKGGPPLAGKGLHEAFKTNGVQCNYMRSKAAQHFSRNALPSVVAPEIDIGKLVQAWDKAFPTKELEQSLKKMKAFAKDIHDVESFLEVAVLELLEAAKDIVLLILSGIKAILLDIAGLAGAGIDGLERLGTHKPDIPVISWLYKKYAKAELTIFDLTCLILAVPATILYQVLYGGKEERAPFDQSAVDQITSHPIPWPGLPQTTTEEAEFLTPFPFAVTLTELTGAVFVFYWLEDVVIDLIAAIDATEPLPPRDDGVAEEWGVEQILSVTMVSTSVILAGLTGPYIGGMEASPTKADKWSTWHWVIGLFPIVLDIVCIASSGQRVARLQEKWGTFATTGLGALMLGLGVPTALSMQRDPKYKKANEVEVLLAQVPGPFKVLALAGIGSLEAIATQAILAAINTAGDLGAGLAYVIGSEE